MTNENRFCQEKTELGIEFSNSEGLRMLSSSAPELNTESEAKSNMEMTTAREAKTKKFFHSNAKDSFPDVDIRFIELRF